MIFPPVYPALAAKNTTQRAEETNEAAQKLSKMATELRAGLAI
jgi:hypothetical protein